jgi:hypothetical protein
MSSLRTPFRVESPPTVFDNFTDLKAGLNTTPTTQKTDFDRSNHNCSPTFSSDDLSIESTASTLEESTITIPSLHPHNNVITLTTTPEQKESNATTTAAAAVEKNADTTTTAACYLVYEPDSSGRLVEYYSMTHVPNAVGKWLPGGNKKIANFKMTRNAGRNVLIGNCSAGVQVRVFGAWGVLMLCLE